MKNLLIGLNKLNPMKRIFIKKTLLITLCIVAFSFGYCKNDPVIAIPIPKQDLSIIKQIKLSDENIEYVGRWDKFNSNNYHSYWGGAYFDISFNGNKVILNLGKSVNIYVKIDDNEEVLYTQVVGLVKITPDLLTTGVHTVRVIARFIDDEIQLNGISINGELLKPKGGGLWAEFIGDSITSGDKTSKGNTSAYPWLFGDSLKIKHTQISYNGIPLVNGNYFNYSGAPQIGIESAYFNLMQPNHQPNIDWNFKQNPPNLIVVNIGTNDKSLGVTPDIFQSHYALFIQKIRGLLPNTKIKIMIPFNGSYENEIRSMVSQSFLSDKNIDIIETKGWLISSDFVGGRIHPTDKGHIIIANKLIGIIKM
jgi:lysophospholipase L1-like esterase